MNKIIIGNQNYSGRNITIANGKVIIDGKDVTPEGKEINIKVEGNIEILKADCVSELTVTGNCGEVSTQSGDISIKGDVNGSVSSMSGDIDCGSIGGRVSTMSGDINHN